MSSKKTPNYLVDGKKLNKRKIIILFNLETTHYIVSFVLLPNRKKCKFAWCVYLCVYFIVFLNFVKFFGVALISKII